ncbi:MAG TPA: DUF3237 domain-containing protein [Polyangiaceae bacterium]|jgi:hypothetical protein|nr:DUF3237 domain-containing protein [Polyangiaceae bacterium]
MLTNEFLTKARFALGPALDVGATPSGFRRLVPITGGSFDGPRLHGRVLPGGEDRQLFRPDGVLEVEARYSLETHDGVVVVVTNKGLWHGPADIGARMMQGETVDPSLYYFRTSARFEAPGGQSYSWLNRMVIIGTAAYEPGNVVLSFFAVT